MNRRTIFFLILLVIFASRSSIVNAQILSGLFKSKIERAVDRGLRPGGDLAKELSTVEDESPSTAKESAAILKLLKLLPLDQDLDHSKLEVERILFSILQQAQPQTEGFGALIIGGNIELLRILNTLRQEIKTPDEDQAKVMLEALLTLVMFNSQEGTEAVVQAIRDQLAPEEFRWYSIMQWYAHDHRHSDFFFKSFHESLPDREYWDDLLSSANQAALDDHLPVHPFDSQAGVAALKELLGGPAAVNVAVAIAFIRKDHRDQLEDLVLQHDDKHVRLEAAWAYARSGYEKGFERLVEYTADLAISDTAKSYLIELGKEELIPESAREPEFAAKATLANWLAHPNELGRSPDEILVVDHRDLDWPGMEEMKHFWMLRYRLKTDDPFQPIDSGTGLVGSMTWCFFSETFERLSPEDIYAIHCVWESENEGLVKVIDKMAEKDKKELLKEWNGPGLENVEAVNLIKLGKDFGYPRKRVGVFKATVDGQPGLAIVDGEESRWYPLDVFPPDFYEKYVAFIHIGRIRLGFEHWNDRRPLEAPTAPITDEETVRLYEELIQRVELGAAEESRPMLESSSPLARYFEKYAETKARLSSLTEVAIIESVYQRVLTAYLRYLELPGIKAIEYPAARSMYASYSDAIEKTNGPEMIDRFQAMLPSLERIEVWPNALGQTCSKLGLAEPAKRLLEKAYAEEEREIGLDALIELTRIWTKEGRQSESHAVLLAEAEEIVGELKKEQMDVLREHYRENYLRVEAAYMECHGDMEKFPKMTK